MRFVPVKTAEQQAALMLVGVRAVTPRGKSASAELPQPAIIGQVLQPQRACCVPGPVRRLVQPPKPFDHAVEDLAAVGMARPSRIGEDQAFRGMGGNLVKSRYRRQRADDSGLKCN